MAAGFAVATWGGPWALFIDAASFVLLGLLLLTLPTITREPRVARPAAANRWLARKGAWASKITDHAPSCGLLLEGSGALFSLRDVPALTLLSLVFFFSYGPLEAALPVYSGQTLHANADGYGLLWSGFGVGAFAGVRTLARDTSTIMLSTATSRSPPPAYASACLACWTACSLLRNRFFAVCRRIVNRYLSGSSRNCA